MWSYLLVTSLEVTCPPHVGYLATSIFRTHTDRARTFRSCVLHLHTLARYLVNMTSFENFLNRFFCIECDKPKEGGVKAACYATEHAGSQPMAVHQAWGTVPHHVNITMVFCCVPLKTRNQCHQLGKKKPQTIRSYK